MRDCRSHGFWIAFVAALVVLPAIGSAQETVSSIVSAPTEAIRVPTAPLSPKERKTLLEVEAAYRRYAQAAEEHQSRVVSVLRREFTHREQILNDRYAKQIAHAEKLQVSQRRDAIAQLEVFIKEHPSHKEYTPDAMFRLASLYIDEAEYELDQKEALADAGLSDEDLFADYGPSKKLWNDILARFPDFRQTPGALYLLAYYGRIDDERKSLQLFLSLVCANRYKPLDPPPRQLTEGEVVTRIENRKLVPAYEDCSPYPGAEEELIVHAWVRGVGDHHFSIPGELDEALAAYKRVTSRPASPLYMEGLYKEAWTYYRRDYLLDAIKGFDESVSLYDRMIANKELPQLELREESLQYIAVGFTDPWEGETDADPDVSLGRVEEFYKDRESEPHVRDVWETVGQAFMDLQAWDQAVVSFQRAISAPWQLHRNNPVIHQKIVDAYSSKGDKYAADRAAGELAQIYAPGTPWYAANEKDRDAMENYRRIGERMLYAAAKNTHLSATEARKDYAANGEDNPDMKKEYLDLYADSVVLYNRFIEQYPESDHVYDFSYAIADALFFGERYLESVEYYTWVRDHRELGTAFFEPSARSIVQAYEAEVDRQVTAGNLEEMKVPDVDALAGLPKPITPRQIPNLYLRLQQAWDEYQTLINDPKTAPEMGVNAALVSVSYLHMNDAERRFQKVLDKFCGTPASAKAKDGLLVIYNTAGDEERFKQTNDNFVSNKCGDEAALELAMSQNRSLEFQRANELYAQASYSEAANQYYSYYKTAPDKDEDGPTALYNAAFSLQKAGKPKSAIGLYKQFTENKKSLYRDSPYYLESLRQTAKAYQSSYDYEKSVKAYVALAKQAKSAKAKGLTPPPNPDGGTRSFDQIYLDSLYNAAALSELDRDFDTAIRKYKEYERVEQDPRKSDRALWAMARIYRSRGDVKNLIKVMRDWRKKYGSDPQNVDDYVRSFDIVSKAYERKNRGSSAEEYKRYAIEAWEKKGRPTGGKAAKMAGGHQLYFAEKYYRRSWVPFRITRQARNKAKANAQKLQMDKARDKAISQYRLLDKFQVAEYSMASKVRYGEILASYGPKFLEIPTPKHILSLDKRYPEQDVLGKYEAGISQILEPQLATAKSSWVEVVSVGKQNSVSNEWTQQALENLSREFPEEYQALNQEIVEGTKRP